MKRTIAFLAMLLAIVAAGAVLGDEHHVKADLVPVGDSHVTGFGAKRHPHADLVSPLRDAVRDDAVQADRRERQRHDREDDEDDHRDALARDRRVEHLLHRPRLHERQILVEIAHGRFQRRHERRRIDPASNDDRHRPRRLLHQRQVRLQRRLRRDAVELHVRHDADDLAPGREIRAGLRRVVGSMRRSSKGSSGGGGKSFTDSSEPDAPARDEPRPSLARRANGSNCHCCPAGRGVE